MARPRVAQGAVVVVAAVALALCWGQLTMASAHSIDDYGAVANDASDAACFANAHAIQRAFLAANQSPSDKVVLIPAGNNYTIYNATMSGLRDTALQLDGRLLINNNVTGAGWPWSKGFSASNFGSLFFTNCYNLTLGGSGVYDGQGYNFWWANILQKERLRPHALVVENTQLIEIKDLEFRNSPQFHVKLHGVKRVHVHDFKIIVDVDQQKELLQRHGHWDLEAGIPTFPLNTDGIDPSGIDVLIENVYIENFDDAIAVKPSNSGSQFTDCSRDMVVRNSAVKFSVGLTIGSVPPNAGTNCVKNITFENIVMDWPIKAVYIKSNPGTVGDGIVDGITYRNIVASHPLWYPLWIGPQQQQQPGTAGTGCSFLYPIVKTCPTQPRVTIQNVLLDNVTFTGGLTLPGVLLANASNPYTNITFNDVSNTGSFLVQKEYVSINTHGVASGKTSPVPAGFTQV